MSSEVLEQWLEDVVSTPGLTALRDLAEARRTLVDDALRALPLLRAEDGPVVDVGSGTGSPGVPLAVALPGYSFVLLEAARRKCEFLARAVVALPNVEVVWGRAEAQAVDSFGVALAKALAKPPVATELCLPLVRPSGAVLLWVGPTADASGVDAVARRLGGELEAALPGILVIRKVEPTPDGFPRRPGVAKKRPLV